MYPASDWRYVLSPGHDDDAHVPILINPSVTGNQLAQPGSPARRLTVLSSVLSSADSGELSRRRRGGGKVESVVGFLVGRRKHWIQSAHVDCAQVEGVEEKN